MGMSFKDKERFEILDEMAYEMFKDGYSITHIGKELKIKRQALAIRLKKKYGIEYELHGKKPVDSDFFKKINEESIYWLGYIFADGSIDNRNYLEIITKDQGHLEKFRKSINSDHKISQKRVGNSVYFRITIKDKSICDDLRNWGIVPRKSFKDIPFPEIPRNMVQHFLRGFFDGDGNYYIRRQTKNHYPYVNFSIGFHNKKFSEGLFQLLDKELEISVAMNNQRTCTRIRTRTKDSGFKFINFIYSDSNVYLERKFEQVKNFLPS